MFVYVLHHIHTVSYGSISKQLGFCAGGKHLVNPRKSWRLGPTPRTSFGFSFESIHPLQGFSTALGGQKVTGEVMRSRHHGHGEIRVDLEHRRSHGKLYTGGCWVAQNNYIYIYMMNPEDGSLGLNGWSLVSLTSHAVWQPVVLHVQILDS